MELVLLESRHSGTIK